MKKFLVGGAVRDYLLGIKSKDNDYVVVGSSAEELLANGYKQVGSNFPVFLDPNTGEEYALARREKKTGPGYGGFSVEFDKNVTLEEDLARRDLTINAMALMEDGTIVDPFGGQQDLKDGVLRHVSNAFAEDPLRVLRVIRFIARYNFTVHPDTIVLCNKLVTDGELEHLTVERIWKEVSRMFTEKYFHVAWTFMHTKLKSLGNATIVGLFGHTGSFPEYLSVTTFDRQLTAQEVAFFYTNIAFLKIEAMPYVPTDFFKDVHRLQDLYVLHDDRAWPHFHKELQKFVDQNRAVLTQELYRNSLSNFAKLFNDKSFVPFVASVLRLADAIYSLDFNNLLKDIPKDQIKSIVASHKLTAVKEIFK